MTVGAMSTAATSPRSRVVAELSSAAAPVRSPARADPLERARGRVGALCEHDQQLSAAGARAAAPQVARALRAAGQVGDDQALAAAERLHPREQRRRRSERERCRRARRDRLRALRPRRPMPATPA